MRQVFFIVALLFAVAGLVGTALGQSTGTVRGTVTDPSGAVVVGATVAVVTPDGKTLPATTGKNGVYELKGLQSGKYTVTANAQGFAVFVQDDVEVTAVLDAGMLRTIIVGVTETH